MLWESEVNRICIYGFTMGPNFGTPFNSVHGLAMFMVSCERHLKKLPRCSSDKLSPYTFIARHTSEIDGSISNFRDSREILGQGFFSALAKKLKA